MKKKNTKKILQLQEAGLNPKQNISKKSTPRLMRPNSIKTKDKEKSHEGSLTRGEKPSKWQRISYHELWRPEETGIMFFKW